MSLGSKGCDLSHSLVLSLGCLPASIHAIAIRLLEGQDQEKKTGTVKEIEREEAGDVRDLGGLVSSLLLCLGRMSGTPYLIYIQHRACAGKCSTWNVDSR